MPQRTEMAPASRFTCPSAQPDMHEARIFGVLSGTAEEPRVAYLKQEAVIPADQRPDTGDLDPVEAFRFAARCEESRCGQFADGRCSLGRRLVEGLDPVVDALPPCTIRPSCRWHAEEGGAACLRCPQVVTLIPMRAGDRLAQVAYTPGAERPSPASAGSAIS
jgi:hypothetical protein